MEKTKSLQRNKTAASDEDGLSKEKEILRKRVNGLIRRKRLNEVQKLLKKEDMTPWGRDTQAKVCSLVAFSIVYSLNNKSFIDIRFILWVSFSFSFV